jgi:hypothetical protein
LVEADVVVADAVGKLVQAARAKARTTITRARSLRVLMFSRSADGVISRTAEEAN